MQRTGLPVAGFEEFSALSPAGQNRHVGFPAEPELPPETMSARASVCGHANSGQELCYLCHQREKRNVPVFLAEERRAQEQKEDQLLQQFQGIVDADTIMKEQVGNQVESINAHINRIHLQMCGSTLPTKALTWKHGQVAEYKVQCKPTAIHTSKWLPILQ